jgi:3-hydroxyisobutyrate dehydrogenase-like beta-hydroxyacid dehydrogenase
MRVGFVGLGAMGAPIVSNALAAGLPVEVYDVRAEPVAELVDRGATAAPSLVDLAAGNDVIGVCVVDDAQVREVIRGDGGLLSGARPGSVIIVHSTVHPDTCRELDRLCRTVSVEFLEATVSGYADKARSGDLTLMIGGSAAVADRCDAYLSAIGGKRFLLGPVGSGSVAKLANNVMAIFAKLATFEGLNVARANGVDVDAMVEVAMVSTGYSEGLKQWKAAGHTHDPDPDHWETLGSEARRILGTALAISREHGVDLPVVAAVLDLMANENDEV